VDFPLFSGEECVKCPNNTYYNKTTLECQSCSAGRNYDDKTKECVCSLDK